MKSIYSITKVIVNPNLIIEITRHEDSPNIESSQLEIKNIILEYFKNGHPVFSFYSLAYTLWNMIDKIKSVKIYNKNGDGVKLKGKLT